MRVAVTGGSGRLGRAVVDALLARGDDVVSLDRVEPAQPRAGVRYVVGETSDHDLLVRSFAGCDALLHAAAVPVPFREPDHVVHNSNVVGSYTVMVAAVACGITRICQTSSVNAVGMSFSRAPRFDYLPLDEHHPTYAEDPYSLSKWVCEVQADALARRHEGLRIASLRLAWVVPDRDHAVARYHNTEPDTVRNLWAHTTQEAAVRACLLGLEGHHGGHEVFCVTAPDSVGPAPSRELAARFYAGAEVRGDLAGYAGFFDCTKAERLLGWRHDDAPPTPGGSAGSAG